MYVAMLKSQTVEDAMVKKYGLMQEFDTKYLSDARKAFEREATVDGSGKDGLIRVSIEARNPDRAAQNLQMATLSSFGIFQNTWP